jgi:hypothetical protein
VYHTPTVTNRFIYKELRMNPGQVILYLFIALALYMLIKRIWLAKTIKHYTPKEASEKLINSRSVLLLDVRTLKERKAQSDKKISSHSVSRNQFSCG